jgi:hypothetical protein
MGAQAVALGYRARRLAAIERRILPGLTDAGQKYDRTA